MVDPMAILGEPTFEQRVMQAELAWHVERQKKWKRIERISLVAALTFSFLFVVLVARIAAHTIICYRVGC